MKFFTLAALLLPAMSLAMPSAVVERRDTDPSTADIENYISVSENTVDKLTIFGCNIKECVEALAPLVSACAQAAALKGKDKKLDATCVATAYQDLTPSKKPSECNHCYH